MKYKDYYNDTYVLDFSQKIHSVIPDFDNEAFDAPEKAEFIIAQWTKTGQSKAQEWIIKHGRRSQKVPKHDKTSYF